MHKDTKYGEEASGLKIHKIMGEFLFKNIRNFGNRVFYNYYLRDMSIASIELPLGLVLMCFGLIFGGHHWLTSWQAAVRTSAGTIMLPALPLFSALQLILAFLAYDISSVQQRPLHRKPIKQMERI